MPFTPPSHLPPPPFCLSSSFFVPSKGGFLPNGRTCPALVFFFKSVSIKCASDWFALDEGHVLVGACGGSGVFWAKYLNSGMPFHWLPWIFIFTSIYNPPKKGWSCGVVRMKRDYFSSINLYFVCPYHQ